MSKIRGFNRHTRLFKVSIAMKKSSHSVPQKASTFFYTITFNQYKMAQGLDNFVFFLEVVNEQQIVRW
jgi:hypothetical protein